MLLLISLLACAGDKDAAGDTGAPAGTADDSGDDGGDDGGTDDDGSGDDGSGDDGSGDGGSGDDGSGDDGGADDGTGDDGGADDGTGDDGGTDDGGGDDGGGDDGATEEGVPTSDDGRRIVGEVTWTLDFDAEAEAAGYSDCAYTRSYTGTEIRDQPYLCPDCFVLFHGDAEMTEGYDDCYYPIFGGAEFGEEYWGYGVGETAGEIGFYRTTSENISVGLLSDLPEGYSEVDTFTMAWSSEYELTAGGTMALSAAGEATIEVDTDLALVDPTEVRKAPYDCGWPTANPGGLSSPDSFIDGEVIPAGLFEDSCGQQVSLWDFYGSYLILDAAQPDCGPCQDMSEAGADAMTAMRDAGLDVYYITLLGAGLSAVNEEPSDANWSAWLSYFENDDPILKDRGYGYATLGGYFGDELGYPTWAIVRPDMTLMYAHVGYGRDTWGDIQALIEEDLGE